jgi:hypothetical protein
MFLQIINDNICIERYVYRDEVRKWRKLKIKIFMEIYYIHQIKDKNT